MKALTGFHGSTRKFEAFDPSMARRMGDFGPGIYFALDERDAVEHGSFMYVVKLRLQKPMKIGESSPSQSELEAFWRLARVNKEDRRFLGEEGDHVVVATLELIRHAYSPSQITWMLKKLGYDSILISKDVINDKRSRFRSPIMEEYRASAVHGDYAIVFDADQVSNIERTWTVKDLLAPRERA